MTVRIGISYLSNPSSGASYLEAVQAAGAEPVLLATAETCPQWPSAEQAAVLFRKDYRPIRLVEEVDGLLLTGGGDLDPMLYREPMDGSEVPHWPRDHLEMAQVQRARRRGIPILGICRGIQFLNVAFGGALVQHLPTAALHQTDPRTRQSRTHPVRLLAGSALGRILTGEEARQDVVVNVNSRHHQGVSPSRIAPGLVVAAISGAATIDGEADVLEGLETPATRAGREFVIGVQWHPERVHDPVPLAEGQVVPFQELSERLFRAFVRAAGRA